MDEVYIPGFALKNLARAVGASKRHTMRIGFHEAEKAHGETNDMRER